MRRESFPPDSEQQQACVTAVVARDGFNWGYDPLHYTAPEGSYSTNPEGTARNREFWEMVKGLNRAGQRAVMDVVYNRCGKARCRFAGRPPVTVSGTDCPPTITPPSSASPPSAAQ